MKIFAAVATCALALGAPAFAEGDADKGAKAFNKCKSCHQVVSDTGETLVKGGRIGPNLWGVAGRTAGTIEDFRYGDDLVAAGAAGLTWDEAHFAEYLQDPRKFLQGYLDDTGAKSNMAFRLKSGAEDLYAFLAQYGPQAAAGN